MNEKLAVVREFTQWLCQRTPAGRCGNVEELIGAAIFLSSDASSFVNGHTLMVNTVWLHPFDK
ncbi:hypothetical protein MSKU9_0531 [Komagataeibacter diospyri]|uniref:Uncharacterized protein n=1 Tax=Komagataeibacter diospyri TaxID=1932662 RepID=A0A4P5NKZ8_9PROT|nr:hypothetical protein MSKU9_0531 [Komagataeibacter diospyri]